MGVLDFAPGNVEAFRDDRTSTILDLSLLADPVELVGFLGIHQVGVALGIDQHGIASLAFQKLHPLQSFTRARIPAGVFGSKA